MKSLKNLIIIAVLTLGTQIVNAQSSGMKNPVSFKLKNGLTVIIAENQDAKKVYANLTSETEQTDHKAGVPEVLNAMLNADDQNSELIFNDKGANISTTAISFSNTLNRLSTKIKDPVFSPEAFEKAITTVSTALNAKGLNETSLQALTLNDIKTYYGMKANPAISHLTIAGNITPAAVKALVKKYFGEWSPVTPEFLASE
jgi:predicted Zn-dependent peptidase